MSKFNKLSRAEMKNVLGGNAPLPGGGSGGCANSSCSVFDEVTGITTNGRCAVDVQSSGSTTTFICYCNAVNSGVKVNTSGKSHCNI
ncbi:hypothetical protein [Mucilaginibacter phyllosphaerae]|uniref:Bacteriocin n=1 Tax=Mucilaginibacter phyllosphaerae TaxID=1812349 RepID=A0A4Y8AGV7_9SPHI|nr:hypothetical protein [Mucilaginibacter phyllosphaerae]MBB3968938.1 hypothetical protein [Mucilaginibacter phyllosphaerae]TEW67439.1 hypothetical protein E2R65_05470 [Mucilaginibacter phyllosphaerae]